MTAININVETETETIDDYNKMWERVVEFLRLVLSNKDVPRKYYSPHTNAIKDILSICVNAVPRKKYSELEVALKCHLTKRKLNITGVVMRLSTITIAVEFQLLSRLRCPLILNDINKLNTKEENRLPNYHLIFSSSIISTIFQKLRRNTGELYSSIT